MRRAAAAVVAIALIATACTGGSDSQDPATPLAGRPVSWTPVRLSAGDQPVRVAASGDRLLIGLRRPGARPVPRLMVLTADGRLSAVPLEPKSPYAFEASWQSIATDGSRIIAVGGAPGGAHANTRWTVWAGSTAGVIEKPQNFYTFGGWGAGALLDALVTPAAAAIAGSWGSANAGLDAAIWLPSGDRWIRQNPAGSALESTRELLVGPRSATTTGAGLMLIGSQVRLGDGSVTQQAAVWRSANLNTGWTRLELPDPGDRSEAVRGRCTGAECLISGYVDGRLALWRLDGTGSARFTGLPPIPVGVKDHLAAPFDLGDRLVQMVANSGRVQLVSGDGEAWTVHESRGPVGSVVDAARVGDALYLVCAAAGDGPTTLWRTDLAPLR